jgi:hypothetical protein
MPCFKWVKYNIYGLKQYKIDIDIYLRHSFFYCMVKLYLLMHCLLLSLCVFLLCGWFFIRCHLHWFILTNWKRDYTCNSKLGMRLNNTLVAYSKKTSQHLSMLIFCYETELKTEVCSSETLVSNENSHGVTIQNTNVDIFTTVKDPNLIPTYV